MTRWSQRKTKGQQHKGKIVSAFFHTFWHFSTRFHTFSEFFRIFLQDFLLEFRGCTTVLVQRDEKRIKENRKTNAKPFCTLVVACLSSSDDLERPTDATKIILFCPSGGVAGTWRIMDAHLQKPLHAMQSHKSASGVSLAATTICPKTITLQHVIFGQLILGAVT